MRFFLFVLSFFLFTSTVDARYVRKQPQMPDYFIPSSEMPKSEKLPPINFHPENKVKKATVPTHSAQASQPEEKAIETLKEKPTVTSTFAMPEYQKKYDMYHQNIKEFSRTKKMPKREDIDTDLGKMSTNDEFEVGG